jgi:hypothetical protein
MHDVRRMVALGIKGGGERQNMRGTELHAKATGFTTLHDDRNTSFSHESPQPGVTITPMFNCAGCDYEGEHDRQSVMAVTDCREGKHQPRWHKMSRKVLILK